MADEEKKNERIIIYAIAGTLCFMMLAMTSCAVHMNSFTPEEERAEVAITKAKTEAQIEMSKQNHLEEMARLKQVADLIKRDNLDPIAARCAVEGWTEETSNVCLELVKGKNNPKTIADVILLNE